MPKHRKKQKTRVNTGLEAGLCTFANVLKLTFGGDRWT